MCRHALMKVVEPHLPVFNTNTFIAFHIMIFAYCHLTSDSVSSDIMPNGSYSLAKGASGRSFEEPSIWKRTATSSVRRVNPSATWKTLAMRD
jgi:hypothetical protein